MTRLLAGLSVLAFVTGCTPAAAPIVPGSPVSTVGTVTVGVIYTPPGPGLATWSYEIADTAGAFDRVSLSFAVPCRLPSSTPSASNTPSTPPSPNYIVNFVISTSKAKITVPCDAAAGGTATVKVLTTSGTTVTGPTFSVLGPR
ncbi:MAG: hypothetical protein J0J01_12370 [Reyranella sp.]|uniref:hypothetical protein n=1 Tax=Reyranella sp. TaxID=1929291 RepID=UPI001AD05F0B|nr:hypothetical protein [Reyranella sp.]MBN9087696.1 hypothetical protein [Reyranella sp.]